MIHFLNAFRLVSILVTLLNWDAVAGDSVGSSARTERPVVNPHDFRYVLNNPNLCQSAGSDLYMVIWIHTAPLHFKQRLLIRETWGNPMNFHDLKVRTAFFVGDPLNATLQNLLNLEFEKYGDIIEEDFVDTYRNLTYKAIMGMKWVHTHCSNAKIILKSDDDVMIDIFRLVRHVKALHEHGIARERTILCDYWVNLPVNREGKWSVTKKEYSGDIYPPYCFGLALLMTPDLILPLYVESLYTPYFWVDDVYFTGILAQKVNARHHRLSTIVSLGNLEPDAYLGRESDHVFIHVHNADLFSSIWKKIAALYSKAN